MSSNLNQYEYENEFYGFDQPSVVNFVKETVITNCEEALESLGRKMAATIGEPASDAHVKRTLEVFRSSLQKLGPEIEASVTEFFEIQPGILHPSHQLHDEHDEERRALVLKRREATVKKCLALIALLNVLKFKKKVILKLVEAVDPTYPDVAEELDDVTMRLATSLETLPLDQVFENMSLNR